MLPPKELIPFADQLAESLCSENGLAVFRLAAHLHRLSSADSKDAGGNASAQNDLSGSVRVGIWERKSGNGSDSFIRVDTADRWRLWADVPEIAPKSQKQRVVLIGESVARGFFYDPYANPAMVLQHMLRAAAADAIEVIDLARIDLSLASLLKLTQSAIELEPDAIVIFAGNNWHPISGLGSDQLREIALMIRRSGSWKAVKPYLDQHLRRQVESLLADLEEIAKGRGVPIVFLIPEFNLRDWASDAAAPVLLNDSELHQWLRTRKNAERALDEKRFGEAAHLARSLVELDGGTTPVGFNVESKCNIENGQLRVLRENARDAGMALTKHQSPRCFGVVQEVLRKKGHTHGIHIVDLPRRFEEYLGGGLPDRRIFHDYCHLTLEGMKVAMASATEHLLPLLSRPRRSWSSLLDIDCPVPDKVVAEANFLAAVHNANLGNSTEMVRYHLDKAVQYYPAVSRMIQLYLDFHLRRTPSPLCSAFEQMARTESPSVLSLLLRCSRHEKTIHFGLVEELIRVLMTIQPEAAEHARELTIAEHRISPDRLSLLQKPYSAMLSELSWDQERYGYYRSCTRESKFVFVCEKPRDTEFRITSRIHVNSGAREIVVRVNKVSVHTFEAKNTWHAVVFTVPRSALKEGINELEIVWPEDGWIFPERTARITATLESARIPEAGPIFGELYALMVSSVHVQESVSTEGSLLVEATA